MLIGFNCIICLLFFIYPLCHLFLFSFWLPFFIEYSLLFYFIFTLGLISHNFWIYFYNSFSGVSNIFSLIKNYHQMIGYHIILSLTLKTIYFPLPPLDLLCCCWKTLYFLRSFKPTINMFLVFLF